MIGLISNRQARPNFGGLIAIAFKKPVPQGDLLKGHQSRDYFSHFGGEKKYLAQIIEVGKENIESILDILKKDDSLEVVAKNYDYGLYNVAAIGRSKIFNNNLVFKNVYKSDPPTNKIVIQERALPRTFIKPVLLKKASSVCYCPHYSFLSK